ncbi:hypothetical protein PWT90_00149 [Aphanocladium album]|nr:hypothetical protein PWT90_00149 [Aphanocladium album]
MDNESEPKPRYGEYPLDCYVIRHCDLTRPVTDDGEQWRGLVLAYLQLGRQERVVRLQYMRGGILQRNPRLTKRKVNAVSRITTRPHAPRAGCSVPAAADPRRGRGPVPGPLPDRLGAKRAVQPAQCVGAPSRCAPTTARTSRRPTARWYSLTSSRTASSTTRALHDGLDTARLVDQQPALVVEDAELWEIAYREGSPPYEELAEDSFEKAVRDGQSVLLVADRQAMETQQILVKWLEFHGLGEQSPYRQVGRL